MSEIDPQQWTPTRPFDSSDYLDGDPPTYADDDGDEAEDAEDVFDPSGDEEATDG